MLVTIPGILTPAQLAECQDALAQAEWTDGRATAGYLSQRTKNNEQLPEDHPLTRRLGNLILDQLDRNQQFIAAALPLRVLPPLFNRYGVGQSYGGHIDGAVRPIGGTALRIRTDLSATLFLTDPGQYEGGELLIGKAEAERRIKLEAGDMVLYSGGTVHRVQPVTRGVRTAAFLWVQSMVRNDSRRDILLELDTAIQKLSRTNADHDACVQLAGIYHNLLREWSDT